MNEQAIEAALLPCPFCGGKAHFVRKGSARQSCIVACTYCGCSLETGEVWNSGTAWNNRREAAAAPAGVEREAVARYLCRNFVCALGGECSSCAPGVYALKHADAVLALLPHAPVWQGIETAPKDGMPVLVSWAGIPWHPYPAHCENGVWGGFEPLETQPTHWMNFPTPPAAPVVVDDECSGGET